MIRPLNDNVLIKKENLENKTASGIILSTNENKQENIGVVVAVGEGKVVDGKREPMTVKKNDRVIFDKYSTTEVKYQNEEYLLIAESKILAIVE
ncbi:MAG: co-chaperone GroES [Erysipelotrichaceae bacterium]|nr:co-chaperone GroES [Erysipelotrichaceae bacterium]MBQ7223811.1 co-chaperone GroES [Erysipelotrichaceae bacterium]